jgi:hypothetical protein
MPRGAPWRFLRTFADRLTDIDWSFFQKRSHPIDFGINSEEIFPLSVITNKKIDLVICIAPTQPFRVVLGAESRVCYPGYTADGQLQWALTYCYLSQSTANQNDKFIQCHRWVSNPRPSHFSDRSAKSHPTVEKLPIGPVLLLAHR